MIFVTNPSPTSLKEMMYILRVDLQMNHDYLLVAYNIWAKQRPEQSSLIVSYKNRDALIIFTGLAVLCSAFSIVEKKQTNKLREMCQAVQRDLLKTRWNINTHETRRDILVISYFPFNLHFLTSAVGNVTLVSRLEIINEKVRISRTTLDAYVERKATTISPITVVNTGFDANHRISRAGGMVASGAI